MNKNYQKLLLSELRFAIIKEQPLQQTNQTLIEAVTLNENLISLGYVLKPEDVIRLSKDKTLYTFYNTIQSLIDNIEANPMYPNFPIQVMEMDEATFRFHQLVHYFSTYGIESLFDGEVKKGWLPSVASTKKTERDSLKLDAKVIELLTLEEAYTKPLQKILAKRERMTIPECQIVAEACKNVPFSFFQSLSIPFKENLLKIFQIIFDNTEGDSRIQLLHALCQHTGDVLRCADYTISQKRYKLKKAERRAFVHLLETYPIADFKANLMLSHKKEKRNKVVLNYMNFNEFSRSKEHKKIVFEFRNGQLKSWEGEAKALLASQDADVLNFIAKRPGLMLRWVAWLIRLGYAPQEIANKLSENVETISLQTLVTTLTHFGQEFDEDKQVESTQVYNVFYEVLSKRLEALNTPLKSHKIFIDEGMFSFADSLIECNTKSEEGGYIRSGLAVRIPEDVKRLRFFVYWDDKQRVDVDLHASGLLIDGRPLHIGWNSSFKEYGVCFSGDITHSNAAEYIDVDLSRDEVDYINANINIYSGKPNFKSIEKCFVGIMGVNDLGERVRLYDPANCFFSHNLQSDNSSINYGYIDVQRRLLVFDGKQRDGYSFEKLKRSCFSLKEYIKMLIESQGAKVVKDKEKADFILSIEKVEAENNLSLIDENFFMEY